MINSESVAERTIKWTPDGWDHSSDKICVVRDGQIDRIHAVEYYFLNKDIDGCIDWLKMIKRAMAETKK